MASWYDPLKTYCLIEVVNKLPSEVIGRPENENFVCLMPAITSPEDEDESEDDQGESGLALTFSIDSFLDVTEGHGFGRDPEQCDVLLGDAEGYDVDELHFRIQLDYTEKDPELDIINCSRQGITIDNRILSHIGQRVRVYQGDIVQLVAGNVEMQFLFPFLDLRNPKMMSRWQELRMVAWSLLRPSLRSALIPADIRDRYLDAEEECVWQEARPFRFETGSMTVTLAKGKLKQKTGFPVVLKKLRDTDGDTREQRLNLGETNAMTRVRHENLVSAFRDTWEPGNVILVEYSPHGNISDFIRNHTGRRLKEDAVMDLALQTLRGLAYLGAQGLAHRDVKPSKIMVFRTDPPQFKLTDFGGEDLRNVKEYLQERIDDATIDYVAMEVFERGPNAVATKADVWSLGIVMWELLVGTTPIAFAEEMTYMSAFRAILNWQPRTRELDHVGVSDEGQELLLRMLEKNVKFRPDVEALRVDDCFDYLEQVRKNEPCDLQDCIL